MPRKKPQTTTTPPENYSIQETENRWLKFASSYHNNPLNQFGSAFINDPYLLNQRIKQLRTQPNLMSREEIESALSKPEDNEYALRTATHSAIYLTYPLYRLQYLYEGILKYRSYLQPLYVSKEDMDKPRFKSDWKFLDKWHKKLCPEKQFRRIVGEIIPEGKRAYYLRQSYCSNTSSEEVNYVYFEQLPSDWYKIIKHSTDSYEVVAFNFTYFWKAGTDLGQFPEIFQKYYNELMEYVLEKGGLRYIDIDRVSDNAVVEYNSSTMTWAYWKELPANECFVFCFTEADDLQCSPFAPLLLQAQDLASYSLLQQQLLSVPLYSIILGELPMADHNKSGSHIDDLGLSPEVTNLFENKVNDRMPPGTSFAMVPSQKNELHHFQEVPNSNEIYNKGLQGLINTSGTSTLMTTTEKPSVAQVAAGKIIETRFIDRVYAQFAWACNIILRDMWDRGDLKYEWHFRIFGDAFSEKEKIAEVEKSLSAGQIEFMPEYLAYHDMSLLDAVTTADWVLSTKLYDKFKPLQNTFGMSNSASSGGRPKKAEDQIDNDSTAVSVDSGTNTADMR